MTKEKYGITPPSIDDLLSAWEDEGKKINAPMVFISYAYVNPEHCQWVKMLCGKLRSGGVNAIIDEYVPSGYELAQFMEKGLRWPGIKHIICVCSDLYTQKATDGKGGVGYEKMLVTRDLVKQIDTNKLVPILRDNPKSETPDFLGTRRYLDFRNDSQFEEMFAALCNDILGVYNMPPIGKAMKQDLPASSSPQSQYLIPAEDADLLTWVQSVLHPEGFKLLAKVYDLPPKYVIGSPEKKKGFQVGFDQYYGSSYKVGKYPDFLDPSWYNGNEAHEIFLKYGLIELWVETKTGNFYALTPKCEELICRIRSLLTKTEECKS